MWVVLGSQGGVGAAWWTTKAREVGPCCPLPAPEVISGPPEGDQPARGNTRWSEVVGGAG